VVGFGSRYATAFVQVRKNVASGFVLVSDEDGRVEKQFG
jgi:hypothetical protein